MRARVLALLIISPLTTAKDYTRAEDPTKKYQ
jgi:hypothetical protein